MTTAEPTFSVIVNTINRAIPLRTLLRALEHQSYPHFEVVVVVGPGTDNTLDMLKEYDGRVRVLRCPKANLSQSRNIGLLAARGELVVYIDDDAVPCRTWLAQLARLFEDPLLDSTGGRVYSIHQRSPLLQYQMGVVSSLSEHIDVQESWLESIVPDWEGAWRAPRTTGGNMAVRRQALLDVGGFDEFYIYISEETDLAMRLAYAGKITHPVREAPVYHVPASSHNRTVFKDVGRFWWLVTRAQTYFAIKNGRTGGDAWTTIARRCLHLVHGHWLLFGELQGDGRITLWQRLRMSLAEFKGAAIGIGSGLLRPPQLISPAVLNNARPNPTEPFMKYQNEQSATQPTVDPITGMRPSITLSEPPLRLCLLSSTYPPTEYGGVGRLTNLMARGLFELGHTVHVVTGGETDRVSFYDGAYVHTMPYRLERYFEYKHYVNVFHTLNRSHAIYETVRRLKLNEDIQLVDSPLWLYEGLATAVSGLVPVVVRLVTAQQQVAKLHNEHSTDHRLIGQLEKLLVERSAHILPNTQATLTAIQQAFDFTVPPEQCTIVPYGIVPAPDEAVRPFDVTHQPETLNVLFVGRLEKRKGIQDLFEAIPLVLSQVPNARFVIAGSDNSYWDGFQKRTGLDYPTYFARNYAAYASQVTFTGSVSDDTLQQLYAACDLFVAPSLYESFGLIYLEAMNYAKPVIGCRAGGIPEVIDHQSTGLLVDPAAPRQLAEAIISVLKSPTQLREMGLAGRQQIRQRFHYLTMARNFERAYRQVIHAFEQAHRPDGL